MSTAESPFGSEQVRRMRQAFLAEHPPQVKFAADIRAATEADPSPLDHFEFMTAVMEVHPIFPFEQFSFGSDLLDARRAFAYQIIVRQFLVGTDLTESGTADLREISSDALERFVELHPPAE